MLRRTLLLAAALSISACTVAPYKQPLDPAASTKLAQPTVYAHLDERGVGVEYFAQDSSAAGAPYGLLGALVAATMDGIMNAGPIDIAQNGADELAPTFKHEDVSATFTGALNKQLTALPLFQAAPTIKPLTAEQKWEAAAFTEQAVLLTKVEYALSQDFRSLHVSLTATAFSQDAAAVPANGKAKARKADAGRIYRNRMEYHSAQIGPLGEKPPEQLEREIADIKAKYPKAKRDAKQRIVMQKEIQTAQRETPADKKARLYLAQWLANDAALFRSELQHGLEAVVELLLSDLQDPAQVDTKAKQPKTVIVERGDRRVMRSNLHPFMGSLSSEPVNFVQAGWNGVAFQRKPKADVPAANATAKGR